ncbi:DUF459 domain-containing protein [Enterococcus sp. LJL99]
MKTIAIFGDSITVGWFQNRSTTLLKELLEEQLFEYKIEAKVVLFGVAGEDTNDGLKRIKDVQKQQADYVLIFFGANDAAKHHNVNPKQYQANVTKMLSLIEEKVILCTPPRVNEKKIDTSERTNKQVANYVQAIYRIHKTLNIPIVDVYQAMSQFQQPETLLQEDGLHLSLRGYQLLTSLIVSEIRKDLL